MKYKNIKNAYKKARNYITLADIISGRFYHAKKGYTSLKIDDIDLNSLLIDVIGGRRVDYKSLIQYHINHKINYGIFERIIYNGKRWNYTAGQDYTAELNTIRKLLRGV